MPRKSFLRHQKDPTQYEKLPGTRPTVEWRGCLPDLDEARSETRWTLFFYFLLGLGPAVLACVGHLQPFGQLVGILALFMLFVVCLQQPRLFLFAIPAGVIAAWSRLVPGSLFVFALTTLVLLWIFIAAFVDFYAMLASCAPLPPDEQAKFRADRKLPAGVTAESVGAAYCEALVYWFNYDREPLKAPGLCRPRSFAARAILTAGPVFCVSLTLTHFAILVANVETGDTDLAAGCFLVVAAVAPLPVCLGAAFVLGGIDLAKAYGLKRHSTLPRYWKSVLKRIEGSSDPGEQNSLLAGFVAYTGAPILLPVACLGRHMWLVGSTGSGKTTYLLMLLEQLIARGDSVFYVDMKSDDFAAVETMSLAAGPRPLRILTNRDAFQTHLFSLHDQSWWSALTPTQHTDVQLGGMGLSFSRSYGESYYTDVAFKLLDHVNTKYPRSRSFFEQAENMANEVRYARPHELSQQVKRDGEHVAIILRRLASAPFLNADPAHPAAVAQHAVDMAHLFRRQVLVYAAFSSILAPVVSPEHARILVSALLTAATTVRDRTNQVVLIVDEFQQMVAPGTLALLLRQARSLGISVILTNQTVDDLKAGSFDLTSTVEGNTATQMWFKVTDEQGLSQIQRLAGLVVETLTDRSVSSGPNGCTTTVNNKSVLVNRMEANDIIEASAEPCHFLMRVTDNRDYAQFAGYPFEAYLPYHLTEADYAARVQAQWPTNLPGTFVSSQRLSLSPAPPANNAAGRLVASRPAQSPIVSAGTVGGPLRRIRNRP